MLRKILKTVVIKRALVKIVVEISEVICDTIRLIIKMHSNLNFIYFVVKKKTTNSPSGSRFT